MAAVIQFGSVAGAEAGDLKSNMQESHVKEI
jgi:hypothetical protein